MKKRILSLIIIAVFTIYTLIPSSVLATTNDISSNISSDSYEDLEEYLEEQISNEEIDIDLENVDFNEDENEVIVEASFETNDKEENNLDLAFDIENSTVILNTIDEEGNKKEYEIKITNLDNDEVSFYYEDVETGEKNYYDSTKVTASIAPAIAIAGIEISGALLTLIANGVGIIIVSGSAYLVATKAIPKLKKKEYSHFEAVLKHNNLYIGKGLSKSAAIKRAKKGKDVYSISKTKAKEIAAAANPKGNPFYEIDKDKKGKYYHWHPYKKQPHMHSFHGVAQ